MLSNLDLEGPNTLLYTLDSMLFFDLLLVLLSESGFTDTTLVLLLDIYINSEYNKYTKFYYFIILLFYYFIFTHKMYNHSVLFLKQ